MVDLVEDINGSIVQHGPHSDRVYLMRLNTDDAAGLIAALDDLAVKNDYGKILAKIPAPAWSRFKRSDYVKEAVIPRLYAGSTDGFFIAKYFSAARQKSRAADSASKFARPANSEPKPCSAGRVNEDIVACIPRDVEAMSAIYRQVFSSYPFPIHDPHYLKRRMKKTTHYYCIRAKGRMAAVAAAEIDTANQNAEMTDFATLPKWRGRGFAGALLHHMERQARRRGIQTAYTIARVRSDGINLVFKNGGYRYAGLLINNTHICGSIQSMTVWYKHL